MWDADRAVITDKAARPVPDFSERSEEKPAAYPVLTKGSHQFLTQATAPGFRMTISPL